MNGGRFGQREVTKKSVFANRYLIPSPKTGLVLAAVAATLFTAQDAAAALHGEITNPRGAKIIRMCQGCHSLKAGENFNGPSLYGVYGRRAGSVPGYPYSKALKVSGIMWNDQTLDRWLTNPWKYVSGNRMRFPGLGDPKDRSAVIGFLKAAAQ